MCGLHVGVHACIFKFTVYASQVCVILQFFLGKWLEVLILGNFLTASGATIVISLSSFFNHKDKKNKQISNSCGENLKTWSNPEDMK